MVELFNGTQLSRPPAPSSYEVMFANLVYDIMSSGELRETRNAKTKSVFGRVLRIRPEVDKLPVLCGRRMHMHGVVGELAALLKGPKTVQDFKDQGCNYWDKWGKEDGSIEVDYGNAWLDFNGVNQLQGTIDSIRKDPSGRRHIISGWRPDRLKDLSLPCCHLLYQWYVRKTQDGTELDMIWYQRSVDTMIGLPSDVILAYVWNHLMANETGHKPGEIIMMLGDTHIYEPHFSAASTYLIRVERMVKGESEAFSYPSHEPLMQGVGDFRPKEFQLSGYVPLPALKLDLIV